MLDEKKQQFTLRISQANKTEMIVILYEMILEYLQESKGLWKDEKRREFVDTIYKARKCIKELIGSLHYECEPAPTLLQIYNFCNKELVKADVRNQIDSIENVENILKKLHEAYLELSKQDSSEAIMENAQAVYAGLTYNKNSLSEDMTSQALNRGFRV